MLELTLTITLASVGILLIVLCGVRASSQYFTVRDFDKTAKRIKSSDLPGNVQLNHGSKDVEDGQEELQKAELLKRNQVADSMDAVPGDITLRQKSKFAFTLRWATLKFSSRQSTSRGPNSGTIRRWPHLPTLMKRRHVANSLDSSLPSNPSHASSNDASNVDNLSAVRDSNVAVRDSNVAVRDSSVTGTLSGAHNGVRPSIQEIEIKVLDTPAKNFKLAEVKKNSTGSAEDNPIISSRDLNRVRNMQHSLLKVHTPAEEATEKNLRESEFTDLSV